MELTMSSIRSWERGVVWAALAVLTGLAWSYLISHGLHGEMSITQSASGESGLGPSLVAMSILMWSVMMVAMMLPSAGPMILTYLRVNQQRDSRGRRSPSVWVFVAGYLAIWLAFALTAALLQGSLHQNALLSSAMGHVGPLLAGTLLLIAGIFQFSHLKVACLDKCRSPLSFLMTEWREGTRGALVMGIRHGFYCTGCCWALMLLMFVGGAMNLVWMAGLAVYFLLEKLLPWAGQLRRISGLLFICAGGATLLGAAL
ncbi:DUF2182 domain-containing protein [Marinobacter sp.]|uniref:DUF2182 domain-containing protein n=1 Tax=Marinobacter sp. TaxID=50741 RepID=UPI00384D60FE